jgi:hypothetical protein
MEGIFTYYDMFATKGMEYLIVVSVLVLIIFFWAFVNMDTRR